MRSLIIQTSLAFTGLVAAQRPSDTPICDYYTTALLEENNATNQMTLVTLVVNTAVIGNYTKPNVGIKVDGILAKGKYNNTAVNLAPYFSGDLVSTNGDGKGKSVNFLDDGGAAPLQKNKPANGTESNQYKLLTHLYEYFGALLGCTQYNKPGYSPYSGVTSMYDVHKFMALDAFEVGYFIEQVRNAAASFGVSKEDVQAVGSTLQTVFGHKCSAPVAVLPDAKKELQAICTADDCPVAPNATCKSYDPIVEPNNAANNSTPSGTGSPEPTGKSDAVGLGSQFGLVLALVCIAVAGIPLLV